MATLGLTAPLFSVHFRGKARLRYHFLGDEEIQFYTQTDRSLGREASKEILFRGVG